MTIVVVSIHALDTALGSKTRIAAILRQLRSRYGVESVRWINILPLNLAGFMRYHQLRQSALAVHESATVIPFLKVPFVNSFLWVCYSLAIFIYMLARFGTGKDVVLLAEMTLSAWPFMMYKDAFGIPLLVDAHGINDEYIQFSPRTRRTLRRYAQAVFREGTVLSKAEGIIAVSRKLLELLESRYGFLPSERVVIPSLTGASHSPWNAVERRRAREDLGFENRFVFVYSGSTYPWQCIDETLLIFDQMRKTREFDKLNVLLLMLTWNPSFSAKSRCNALSVSDKEIIERNLTQDQVGRFLQCADVGVLLRRNVTTNLFASPTKAAEYLLSGLPILCTPYVGDVSETVVKMDAGFMVELDKPDMISLGRWCTRIKKERIAIAKHAVRCGEVMFAPSSMNKLHQIIEKVGK